MNPATSRTICTFSMVIVAASLTMSGCKGAAAPEDPATAIPVDMSGARSQAALVKNISVTNVALFRSKKPNSNAWVEFDVSWDNSWRVSGWNWDAACHRI